MTTTWPGRAALLIIDAQEDFMPAVVDAEGTVARIATVLAAARAAGLPIIHSQEVHRPEGVDFGRELDGSEGVHCLEGTPAIDIVEPLRPLPGEFRIAKRRYSCFFATDLEILLKGLRVQTLIVCGFLTDVCVHYTCADAHQHDYFVRVVADGVSGSSVEAHEASLRAIRYLQADAVASVADVVRSLTPGEEASA
jgi:nicotinamidase-related amidase